LDSGFEELDDRLLPCQEPSFLVGHEQLVSAWRWVLLSESLDEIDSEGRKDVY
jgi:hypothetical protein